MENQTVGTANLRVSSTTIPSSAAGAIACMVKDGIQVEITCIGAAAVNQAVKAIAIANGFLAQSNISISNVPYFRDIKIEGATKSAICFIIEPKYLSGLRKEEY